jgi:FHA domain
MCRRTLCSRGARTRVTTHCDETYEGKRRQGYIAALTTLARRGALDVEPAQPYTVWVAILQVRCRMNLLSPMLLIEGSRSDNERGYAEMVGARLRSRRHVHMSMSAPWFTKTDSVANEWAINDQVVQLRQWGTRTTYVLSPHLSGVCTLGAADTCAIQLDDPSARVSRLHARLVHDQVGWLLRDLGSKNGVRIDGTRRSETVLSPGLEIGIGGITLLAESLLSIALRDFLARLLGWGNAQLAAVDHALCSIRTAAARRAALFLCGDGDLVLTARSIHRRSRRAGDAFILCDPRRQPGKATVRSAANHATGIAALAAATGGTLCVLHRRLPRDFPEVIETLRSPNSQVQLMVCKETQDECEKYRVTPIVIPPLVGREAEIHQIIQDYADDAVAELGLTRSGFLPVDAAWVRRHASTSLPEIEKATLRLVALRASRNVNKAAARLGMTYVSLTRWIGRRSLPMEIIS